MNDNKYKKIVNETIPKEDRFKNCSIAFIVGGAIGFLAQIITTILEHFNLSYSNSTSIMIVFLIFISSLLTGLGFFDSLVSKAKAGLIVPITGFAHAMTSSMLDYKNEGLITGIGVNAFKLSGSVIVYGVVSAYFCGIIRFIIFGG